MLVEKGAYYEITVLGGQKGPLGYTVLEIGSDYLLFRDATGAHEIRVPVYAIKAITTLKVGIKV